MVCPMVFNLGCPIQAVSHKVIIKKVIEKRER